MNLDRYKAKEGQKVDLKKYTTDCDADLDKEKVKKELFPKDIKEMQGLQEKLFAENTYGMLIVLQAMDAAGKDGTVNHVFSHLNPSGVHVKSFKEPSSEEKDHDYMWRINKALPRRGEIGIFNRSHYEDVIVTRVHDLIKQENMPQSLIDKDIWEKRFREIRDWEKYLSENGFVILKIFLHLSKDEQRRRLIDRILVKKKNWKFSMSDINERQYWDRYQELYEDMIEHTSTDYAPWYIVPADHKWYSRYTVAEIVLQALKKIDPKFPDLKPEIQQQLQQFQKIIQMVNINEIKDLKEALEKKK